MDKSKEQKATETLQRRLAVMEGYLQGKNQYELARYHEVSQSTISNDLAWVRKQWLLSTLLQVDEAKARELARIDKLENQYWDEWFRSREPATTKRSIKFAKSKPSARKRPAFVEQEMETERTAEEWEEVEERLGDPKYLEGVQWCITQRAKILGLYAPVQSKTEVTGKDGGPIQTKSEGKGLALSYYEMPPDEAARVAAILAEMKVVSEPDDTDAPTP